MYFKKLVISYILSIGVIAGSANLAYAQNFNYTIQSGDTFFLISQKYGISTESLMEANNYTVSTILYPGKTITIPLGNQTIHIVVSGETYWTISKKYGVDFYKLLSTNNATEKSQLNVGDKVIIPPTAQTSQGVIHTVQTGDTFYILSKKYNVSVTDLMKLNYATENTILYMGQKIQIPQSSLQSPQQTPTPTKPYITYTSYTIKSGDNFWNIADKLGVPMFEVLAVNNMNESTRLDIGDVLKIPIHNVPLKSTPGEKYGEYLDWWTEAQYVVPTQGVIEIVDFYTGKSFFAKRTTGASHADVETLTFTNTKKMKEIWGGSFSWTRRPVIVKINGRKIAASASSMPHAGNDKVAGGIYTTWRSDNYPPGYNLDWVKDNGIDGVFDIHFANSTRHKDGKVDVEHQANIKIAAGLK